MNVLLIYPEFRDTFWSFNYALNFIRKKAANPPLGLLTVVAMLPDEFERRLVDVNVDGLIDDDFSWADICTRRSKIRKLRRESNAERCCPNRSAKW
jgi:hypothetical protein